MGPPMQWINLYRSLATRFGTKVLWGLGRDRAGFAMLKATLSNECRAIETHEGVYSAEGAIPIPDRVREGLSRYRSTPLLRAKRWEQAIRFSGEIWIKREDLTPSGSHKYNTAIPQAYYAKQQGLSGIVADTGAGQWGLALAMACAEYGLRSVIFMPGHGYDQRKLYRRLLMEVAGAEVHRPPSTVTAVGRSISSDPAGNGRLSQAMSESYEFAATQDDFCLGQGCMSFYAPLHQSIIGLETQAQLASACLEPDVLVACAGGGTNLSGFMAPWLERALKREAGTPRMLAVESSEVPALTKGEYRFDTPDACGIGRQLKMFTLGAATAMPDIDAAGLRYHAKSPLLSLLVHEGIVEATSASQDEARYAGVELFRTEGILPAPESAHALAAVKQLVAEAIETGRGPRIVVCLSGSGFLDATFYHE
jgi:tryptophan synthase beta chain